jgi:hypothetical protein
MTDLLVEAAVRMKESDAVAASLRKRLDILRKDAERKLKRKRWRTMLAVFTASEKRGKLHSGPELGK